VPDDWFVGFHDGLAARFWRSAAAAMADGDAALVRELLLARPPRRRATPRGSRTAICARCPTSGGSTPC